MVSEIISTVERRRRWSTQEKLRIIEEALTSGASIAAVADRNGVCRSLLYTWLRLVRAGRMPGISMSSPAPASFLPVRIEGPMAAPPPPEPDSDPPPVRHFSSPSRAQRERQVEVMLANGRRLRVDERIDPAALAMIVAALDGGTR